MSFLGLYTKKDVLKLFEKAAKKEYPDWALDTARAERYNLPDPSVYGVQADFYRKLSWVLAAVTHVASEAALTAYSVEQVKGEETEKIPNHPFELLLRKPNPQDSRYEFIYATVAMKKLTGNGYWWMNKANEKAPPDEMWLIPSHMIEPVPDGNLYLKGYIYEPGTGERLALEPWEICHFRSFNPYSRFLGLSAIESLAAVAIGDIGMQEWNTKFFKDNNARLPGILTFEQFPGDEMWNDIKNETRDASRKRELMMLRGVGAGGVNWLQNAVSQKDMEFLLGRKSNRDEIWTVLAPGLASMLDTNATEANAIAGRATFRERAVYPELVTIGEKTTNSILPSYDENLFGAFDDIRYVDKQLELQEMEAYSKTHTVEEIRKEYYSDKPIGDDRDKLFPVQVNATSGDIQKPPEPKVIVQPTSEKKPPKTTPEDENTPKPEEIKAIVELDRWEAKSLKAKKLVTWHNQDIPVSVYEAVKLGELNFVEAREEIKATFSTPIPLPEPVINSKDILEGIRLEVQAIKAQTKPDQQPMNLTINSHNYPGEAPQVIVENKSPDVTVNLPEQNPVVNVNVPDQKPPVINIQDEQAKDRKDFLKSMRKMNGEES